MFIIEWHPGNISKEDFLIFFHFIWTFKNKCAILVSSYAFLPEYRINEYDLYDIGEKIEWQI